MFNIQSSIKEVPTYTEAEDSLVERVVGNLEVVPAAHLVVYMTHHDEESCVLQEEVGIDVYLGEIANLDVLRAIVLHGEGVHHRTVVGGSI